MTPRTGTPRTGTPKGAPRVLRVGTRGSRLAVAQTQLVASALTKRTGIETEIVRVTTHGDVNRASLATLGGTGVFATELRDALRAGECDLVVHSLKDLPTAPAPGLTIAAYPRRVDARDALCSAGGADGPGLDALPHGAKVGTGSPRRIAQLLEQRPDLEIRDIRGNVGTRLAFVTSGELDAVVLACAGLERLGNTEVISERLPLDRFPTAPGQGCLAVEVREGDEVPGVAELDDLAARAAVLAERGVLATLEAGCSAPVAATGRLADGTLAVWASVYAGDGSRRLSAAGTAPLPEGAPPSQIANELASAVAAELLDQGAAALLA